MTDVTLIHYPACSTCQKAKRWLTEQGIEPHLRHIVEQTPTEAELTAWLSKTGLMPRQIFNVSGVRYRELNLKEVLPKLSEAEQIALLASDGKLIKRPLLITPQGMLVGFKSAEWLSLINV